VYTDLLGIFTGEALVCAEPNVRITAKETVSIYLSQLWTLYIVYLLFKISRFGTGLCLHLQIETTHLGPIDRAGVCLRRHNASKSGFYLRLEVYLPLSWTQ
jgi:hypothetical protein